LEDTWNRAGTEGPEGMLVEGNSVNNQSILLLSQGTSSLMCGQNPKTLTNLVSFKAGF
jgi:hypothetical protein